MKRQEKATPARKISANKNRYSRPTTFQNSFTTIASRHHLLTNQFEYHRYDMSPKGCHLGKKRTTDNSRKGDSFNQIWRNFIGLIAQKHECRLFSPSYRSNESLGLMTQNTKIEPYELVKKNIIPQLRLSHSLLMPLTWWCCIFVLNNR